MTTDYKVTELFCIIDEFCKHFDAENAGNLLEDNSGTKRRRRQAQKAPDLARDLWDGVCRKARAVLLVKALHGLQKADTAELVQVVRLDAAAEKPPRHAPDQAGVFRDHLLCRCGVPSLGAPEQVARLLGDHARRRMRRHIVTVVPRPGTDLTRSVSMKLSMIVKPMPLRSSPPVVYSGVRACATSAMPMP